MQLYNLNKLNYNNYYVKEIKDKMEHVLIFIYLNI